MYKPLEGIKVVDFCLAGSGPSCTKLLTEFGASTIWVEPLKGTSTRDVHKFDFYTTGKRAITLNLKDEKGMEVMLRLIKDADVFVTNYRPNAVKRLGLGYEAVKEMNPRIIYASLSGFGETGPDANSAGYDPVAFWAKGGLLQDIAEKGTLVVPPVAVGDIATGAVLAWGIAAGLYGREQTGQGCHVFSSLFGTAAYLNHDAAIEVQYGEEYPKTRLAPRRALLNTYQCSDGKWITITITDRFEKYFGPLLKAIGRDDLVGEPRWQRIEDTMYDKAQEVVAILDKGFAKMTQDEAIAALNAIDAPVSRVQSTAEMMQDPQAVANKYFYKLEASLPPDGGDKKILVPASPVKINDLESGVVGNKRGPRLGEHSTEILREYGYSEVEINNLLESKITSQT